MKNLSLFSPRSLTYTLSILLFVLITFSSCKKEETDTNLSYIRIINSAPTLATYYPFINSTSVSSSALPYGGSTAYTTYATGSTTVKFTSENNAESLFTKTINLTPSTYNSFYLINKPGELEALFISDDLTMASADRAYIRYINLAPDAPALDLAKTGETTALITNKSYKTASGFIAITPGTYTFDAKETSTGAVKAVSTSATFVAGYHYDIICGGLINPANDTERAINLSTVLIK